jgi:hypothetical protein
MRAGDTFTFAPRVTDRHLWMVISDPETYPDDLVVIVSFTSHDLTKDPACVLDLGDHPFIRHETSVAYRRARYVPNRVLDMAAARGDVIPNTPLTPEVLHRVRQGAGNSLHIKEGFRKFLARQGVIE